MVEQSDESQAMEGGMPVVKALRKEDACPMQRAATKCDGWKGHWQVGQQVSDYSQTDGLDFVAVILLALCKTHVETLWTDPVACLLAPFSLCLSVFSALCLSFFLQFGHSSFVAPPVVFVSWALCLLTSSSADTRGISRHVCAPFTSLDTQSLTGEKYKLPREKFWQITGARPNNSGKRPPPAPACFGLVAELPKSRHPPRKGKFGRRHLGEVKVDSQLPELLSIPVHDNRLGCQVLVFRSIVTKASSHHRMDTCRDGSAIAEPVSFSRSSSLTDLFMRPHRGRHPITVGRGIIGTHEQIQIKRNHESLERGIKPLKIRNSSTTGPRSARMNRYTRWNTPSTGLQTSATYVQCPTSTSNVSPSLQEVTDCSKEPPVLFPHYSNSQEELVSRTAHHTQDVDTRGDARNALHCSARSPCSAPPRSRRGPLPLSSPAC